MFSIFSSSKKTTKWLLNITFESVTIHIAGELTIPSASKQWNSFTVVLASGRFVRLFDYNHWIKERRFKATLLKIRQLSVPDYTKFTATRVLARFSKNIETSAYLFRRFPFRICERSEQENGQSQKEDQSKHFLLFFSSWAAQKLTEEVSNV